MHAFFSASPQCFSVVNLLFKIEHGMMQACPCTFGEQLSNKQPGESWKGDKTETEIEKRDGETHRETEAGPTS